MDRITSSRPNPNATTAGSTQPSAAAPDVTANQVVPSEQTVSPWSDGFAHAPTFAPAAARSAAAGPAPASELRMTARAAEARVMAKALCCAEAEEPGVAEDARQTLLGEYAAWREAVVALVRAGELASPEVKSFTSKTQQAALLHQNLPESARTLHGAAFRAAVEKEMATLFTAPPAELLAANPLLLSPAVGREPTLQVTKARGVPTTSIDVNGRPAEVRTDVVMVFCPGVVRTGDEFPRQQEAALKMGLGAVRADTGTFHDPELNAEVIAKAVQEAKEKVGNPDAKVVLVGYSQGATNILSFMRDQNNGWPQLRKDVAGIHMMHPASGGSQLADLAVALGGYLFSDAEPTEKDLGLLRAYYRAKADMLNLPPVAAKVNEEALEALRGAFKMIRGAWRGIERVLDKVGIDVDDGNLRQKLVAWMERNENLPEALAKKGLLDEKTAEKIEPTWDRLRRAYDRAIMTNPEVNGLLTAYLGGGMKSLTTEYTHAITSDPRLHKNLENIPVLNSVGAVPENRIDTLVPRSQKLNMAFFKQLGMESDFQVSVENQRLEPKLPTAIDLPTEAVGHWGVAGLIMGKDHPAELFKDFSAPGLTHSAIMAFGALGVL